MHRYIVFLILSATAGIVLSCGGASSPADSEGADSADKADIPEVDVTDLSDDLFPDSSDANSEDDSLPLECLSDADCVSGAPFCNPSTGKCVGCVEDQHCEEPTGICDTELGTCVGCLKDEHCSDPTPVCSPFLFQCVQCHSPEDCANPLPVCDTATHVCKGCVDSSECAGSPSGWMCHQESGRCVSCLHSDHCLVPTPICDDEKGQCVACEGDLYCEETTPKCDPISGHCVGCLGPQDCPGESPFCGTDHSCVECLKDGDCSESALPYCVPFTGTCGECVVDAHCTDIGKPSCDQDTGSCVACMGSWDCVFPAPNCDVVTKSCVECVTSANCPIAEPLCAEEGFCIECMDDDDCGGDEPKCDVLNHRCVLCQSDADCHPEQPFCATAYGTCNACMNPNGCPAGQKCFFSMCKPYATGPDQDNDTVEDNEDNCPENGNWTQADMDEDGIGDSCDTDIDGDEVEDQKDNCPYVKNPDQKDGDGDGWGDACEGSGIGGDEDRTCATLGFDTAVQFWEGFETGKFFGWTIYNGIAGSYTGSSVMSFIPPDVTAGSAHSGGFGARFPNVSWPGEANHDAFLTLCMPMGTSDTLSVWIRPDKVGYCCGPYGTAAFRINFRKGTQGYAISYSWSYSSNEDSKTHKFVRLDEGGYSWKAGQWNHLEVNLQAQLEEFFGITGFGNVMITEVHVFNHYSNGSPKGFDIDDIELIPAP